MVYSQTDAGIDRAALLKHLRAAGRLHHAHEREHRRVLLVRSTTPRPIRGGELGLVSISPSREEIRRRDLPVAAEAAGRRWKGAGRGTVTWPLTGRLAGAGAKPPPKMQSALSRGAFPAPR